MGKGTDSFSFYIQELADKINNLQRPICQCCANCAAKKVSCQTFESELLFFNISRMINLK